MICIPPIFKAYLPQIYAASVASSVYACVGLGISYSAVVIPQVKNGTAAIEATDTELMWIVNSINVVIPALAIFSGFATDFFGRLWVLKFTVLPHVVGYATIALAKSVTVIIIGRTICGVALVFQIGSTFVYISEISSPSVRGPLLGFPIVSFSIGTVSTYLGGYLMSWSVMSWVFCAYGIICTILLYTLPLSPSWLISKNRIDEAERSVRWLNKFQASDQESIDNIVKLEMLKLEEEEENNKKNVIDKNKWKCISLPTVYKPALILAFTLLLQQFSGVNTFFMNMVSFFNEIGTDMDPYLGSTYISTGRLITTLISVLIMKKCGRRTLLAVSFIGMAISMGVSGLYTKWIHDGTTENSYIPLIMLTLYCIFTVGAMAVPYALSGETFPLHVRGLAANICQGLVYLFTFACASSYPHLQDALGGIHHLQYFFAAVAILGAVFTYFFIPETLNKRLSEIESHFVTRTFAITKPSICQGQPASNQ
ncbi:facilitated trehalose transporter Tret1-like [Photinus pyralis]|uniref:facilitated trehalose transporter Tret1-like n=1 Tax=Photinus pyralis TaxID=7054 RepID=UPI00126750EE|nr:facilitated trehalose transporter Tret1-like [Photinus pyralis]